MAGRWAASPHRATCLARPRCRPLRRGRPRDLRGAGRDVRHICCRWARFPGSVIGLRTTDVLTHAGSCRRHRPIHRSDPELRRGGSRRACGGPQFRGSSADEKPARVSSARRSAGGILGRTVVNPRIRLPRVDHRAVSRAPWRRIWRRFRRGGFEVGRRTGLSYRFMARPTSDRRGGYAGVKCCWP